MNVSFIIYDQATGTIKRTGSCPEQWLDLQCHADEAIIQGKANDQIHKIVNGQVVTKVDAAA